MNMLLLTLLLAAAAPVFGQSGESADADAMPVLDKTGPAFVSDTPGLWEKLVQDGVIDSLSTDVDITAVDAGLLAPYEVALTATESSTTSPPADEAVEPTAWGTEARPTEVAAHGTCTDGATGGASTWDASIVIGDQLCGSVTLSGGGSDGTITVAGAMNGQAIDLSFIDPAGVAGTFRGTIQGSTISGAYVSGHSDRTCIGDLTTRTASSGLRD